MPIWWERREWVLRYILCMAVNLLLLASIILTFVILIVSEIIPKTLGASYWRTLAPMVAYLVTALIFALYPAVWFSEKLNRLLTRKKIASVTREDMIVTAEMGVSEGTIGQKESRIIKNLLMLDTLKVSEIMTPRAVILAFDKTRKVKEVMEKNQPIRFSRVPLYEGSLDQVVGFIHRYKILEAYSHDLFDITLEEYMKPIHSIPDQISVAAALDQLHKKKGTYFYCCGFLRWVDRVSEFGRCCGNPFGCRNCG